MFRHCCSESHKGFRFFGIKRPFFDLSVTDGFCKKCFQKIMEENEIEKRLREQLKKLTKRWNI